MHASCKRLAPKRIAPSLSTLVRNEVSSVSESSNSIVSVDEVHASRFRQFKSSKDIVAQSTSLARLDTREPVLWAQVAHTVTQSMARLAGADLATILKACSRANFRDELMLAGVCENLKTLPQLRLLRVRDIASLLSSFYKLNFVPSTGTLAVIVQEVNRSLDLYRTRAPDLCVLYRYLSVLSSHPTLMLGLAESSVPVPQLLDRIESEIESRIGSFGAVEIAVISTHCRNISLKSLIANFSRAEHVKPQVRKYFIRQLDKRFGQDAWKEYHYLFRLTESDSTGWGQKFDQGDDLDLDDCDSSDSYLPVPSISGSADRLPLFQLDDSAVDTVLNSVPRTHSGRERIGKEKAVKKDPSLSSEQLEFIRQMELDMAEDENGATAAVIQDARSDVKAFTERVSQDTARMIGESDLKSKPESTGLKLMRKVKDARERRLFKFALLSVARQKQSE